MFERFTRDARHTVVAAQREARRLGHDRIGTEHLLLGLLGGEGGGIAGVVLRELGVTAAAVERAIDRAHGRAGLDEADAEALAAIGIDLDEIRRRTEAAFGPGALRQPVGSARRGRLPFGPGAKRALQRGLREAVALRHSSVGTEHLLLGILAVPEDLGAAALRSAGAVPEAVRDGILTELRRAS
jgi:ATP-dependent Clp protease ATP-binding subunit ClpA